MVETKYRQATEKFVLLEQEEGQSEIEEETDRFFNAILKCLRSSIRERDYSIIAFSVKKLSNSSIYLISEKELFESRLDENDFSEVLENTKQIFEDISRICGYSIKVSTKPKKESSTVMMISLNR